MQYYQVEYESDKFGWFSINSRLVSWWAALEIYNRYYPKGHPLRIVEVDAEWNFIRELTDHEIVAGWPDK